MSNVTIIFKKNPLQIFQWSKLNVIIDNQSSFKVSFTKPIILDINPGTHDIKMSFRYLGNECGNASIKLNILVNEHYELTYKPPILISGQGKIISRFNQMDNR